jgi:hypothetical protein
MFVQFWQKTVVGYIYNNDDICLLYLLKAEMVECYYDAFDRLDNQVLMEALVHQGFIFKEVCSVCMFV